MDDSLSLLERLAGGDRSALEPLLDGHLSRLRGYVRLRSDPILRSKEESTDIVQSVCREILENLDRFQYPTENAFRQWLYATALRKIQKRYRFYTVQKRDARRETAAEGDAELYASYTGMGTPSADLVAREEVERVEAAFDRLPDDYREVLVLARLVGLSRAEIGERMGRSETAVRTLLSRAQAKLADLL